MTFWEVTILSVNAQKKTGLILPYLQQEIEEKKQRERKRAITSKLVAKAEAKTILQQKTDADMCADFG